ncbi:unnamed protein product [Polarella glacialis]|uniref:carnosine N-methyltransferase n=1 Tax=Polarella glacialis TaxID=89957 RepID=A0A813D543_POLGL|nr:unnamed protein product [Polarella glacialis]
MASAQSAAQKRQWPDEYAEMLKHYQDFAQRELARVQRNLLGLSDDDKASLVNQPEVQVQQMEAAMAANTAVLDKLTGLMQRAANEGRDLSGAAPVGGKPVQVLLQTLVREWAADGLEERQECLEKLLGALEAHRAATTSLGLRTSTSPFRVMIPGSSVGRLAFEAQARGCEVESCEARLLHFFGSELIRENGALECLRPQPFVLGTCNRLCFQDHVRSTPMPDAEVKEGSLSVPQFGEFIHLYDRASAKDNFDALLTSFSLDVSSNIFRFVRTVAHVVRPGGLWANFGPLAYDTHYEEADDHSRELSWEELRYAVSKFFDIQEEDFVDSLHCADAKSLMQMQYSCVYFKAVRNENPASGIGEQSDKLKL